jgi:trimeric autotransporter adhesin
MKNKLQTLFMALMTLGAIHHAAAQGTAFTYQGRLNDSGQCANGYYNFQFTLYGTPSGGTVLFDTLPSDNTLNVLVTNGLFTVTLDFGPGVFTGASYYLQTAVATNTSSSYTPLAPRTQILPVPYAVYAETANTITGTVPGSQVTGSISAGQLPSTVVVENESSVTLGSLTVSGSTSLQSMDLSIPAIINAGSASFLYGDANGNFVAGLYSDDAAFGSYGSGNTVVGSGASSYTSDNTIIGYNSGNGGSENTAVGWESMYLASGSGNTAFGWQSLYAGSGSYNTAFGYDALPGALAMTGTYNIALGEHAGGNYTSSESDNIDIGNAGVAGESKIIHLGNDQTDTYFTGNLHAPGGMILDSTGADTGTLSNAWSLTFGGAPPYTGEGIGSVRVSGQNDSYGLDFYTDFTKRLVIQNGGNVGIGTTSPSSLLTVAGQISCQSITITSDRNAKEDFASVDPRSVLEKVSTLSVTQWRYKQDTNGFKHIGPMAQDFQAAFGLNGADDRHISVVDEGGVALAAIQGLNEKLEDTRAENAALKRQNDSLAKQLNDLARVVQSLADKK